MKDITYLQILEKIITKKNLGLDTTKSNHIDERNEFNELETESLFPNEIMPNIPDPKRINNLQDLYKYRDRLSMWLSKFVGEPRKSAEFDRGMDLQRKLTFRAMELEAKKPAKNQTNP